MGTRLLWLNPERTIFVESFNGGRTLSVAMRETPNNTWGPPVKLEPDETTAKLFEATGERWAPQPIEKAPRERLTDTGYFPA